jgi:hypothetical protein
MSMSRAHAQAEVNSFNRYFYGLTPEKRQEMYGGVDPYQRPARCSTILSYERCFSCGGPYTNFRDALEGDCPNGCTIQPVIHYGEPKSIDFSTCTPEEAMTFFGSDGIDFDTSVDLLVATFERANRLSELDSYFENSEQTS